MLSPNRVLNILIVIVPLILIYQWFKSQSLIAGAEESLVLYDPSETLRLFREGWIDRGFGMVSPFHYPRIPVYIAAVLLSQIGIATWMIQAIMFFCILFCALYYMKRLVLLVFPEANVWVVGMTVSFYAFNFFTLSQVFNRFIFSLMFLWALLPAVLYYFVRWIILGSRKALVLFLLLNFLLSYAYGLTASVFALWMGAGIFWLFYKTKDTYVVRIKRLLVVFLAWVATNCWWILPLVHFRNSSYGELVSVESNMSSLKEVSAYYPLDALVTLKQNFFYDGGHFTQTFASNADEFVSYAIILILMVGIWRALVQKKYLFIVIGLIISVFFAKGTNPPLGVPFYEVLFKYFPFTQLLRNPYEKLGVVYLLFYTLTLGIGLHHLFKFSKILPFVLVVMYIVVAGKPYFNGYLFDGYYVQVPTYYKEASSYIKQEINNSDTSRILLMPFLRGSTIELDWRYQGADPHDFLFENPTVSRTFSNKSYDDFYLPHPDYFSNTDFYKIMMISDMCCIVVNSDVMIRNYHQEDIPGSIAYISQWNNIKHDKSFDAIDIYSLNGISTNRVYLANNIYHAADIHETLDIVTSNVFQPTDSVVINDDVDISIFEESNLPEYTIVQESNTKHIIDIINAEDPFVLILSNMYSTYWNAKVGENFLDQKVKVNGYAMGWVVSQKGSYSIDIYFDN